MKPQVFYSALLLAGTLVVAGCTRSATDAVLPEETAPAVDEAAAVDAELAAQNAKVINNINHINFFSKNTKIKF